MSDLPEGWEWATLGEVAETSLGKMLDKGRSTGTHPVPYLRNINVQWGRFDLTSVFEMDVAPQQRDLFEVTAGDLLVCEGGEIGRCAIWPGSISYMAFQKALHRVRPISGIDARYLRYLLEHLSATKELLRYSTGSTIKHLPQVQLRALRVPLPPATEQRRIVATLEDHLSRLDAGGRLLTAARSRLERLNAAWRASQIDAAAAPDGRLADVVDSIEAGRSFGGSARPAGDDEWGIIKVSAMTWGDFRASENKVVADSLRAERRFEIKPGDVLVSRANTIDYVGAAVLVRNTRPKLLLSDKSLRLKPKPGIDPRWLVEVLSSLRVRQQIAEKSTGNQESMRNISQAALLSIRLPLHDADQQALLADNLAERRSALGRLEADLAKTEAAALVLRRSLLAEAFAGRLVPQDPNDEPASVLLDRIRTERAAEPKPRRTRRAAAL